VEQGKAEYEGFKIGVPLEGASEVSSELLKIRSHIAAYAINPEGEEPESTRRANEIRSQIEQELPAIEKETEGLTQARTRLETEEKDLEQKIAALKPFAPVPVDLEFLGGYDTSRYTQALFHGILSLKFRMSIFTPLPRKGT